MWILLALSQAPVVVLFSYVYFRDVAEKEPLAMLLKTFLFGALISFPAAILEYVLDIPIALSPEVGWFTLLVAAVFGIGLIEEAAKYFVLRWYAQRSPAFSEPYDGIMYGAAAALGFAALENLFYSVAFGATVAVSRMFTAVPLHAAAGVLMGYYVGRAHFEKHPIEQNKLYALAFWTPVLFHGAYDFLLFLGDPAVAYLSLLVLGFQVRLANRAIREFAQASPLKVVQTIAVKPTPEQVAAPQPAKLILAGRSIKIFGFFFIFTALASVATAIFAREATTDETFPLLCGVFILSIGALPLLRYILKGFERAEKAAWALALALFVIMLGTPLFALAIIGLGGLLHSESRNYFWGGPASEVIVAARAAA